MSSAGSLYFAAGLRSDAVSNATGRGWSEWFQLLDSAGASGLSQHDIERYLHETQGLSGWWSRMVTAGYEQASGKRATRPHGKTVSIMISKVIHTSAESLFKAWADEAARSQWLPGHPLLIRKAVPQRSMRITWSDQITGLVVEFTETGPGTCRLEVRHVHLENGDRAGQMRVFWEAALVRLADLYETKAVSTDNFQSATG